MKMKNKVKKMLAIGLCFALAISTVACGEKKEEKSAQDSKETTDYLEVKILESSESLCLAPLHIAIINGYFDEEFAAIGQEYKRVNAEVSQSAELITSGDINASYGLTASLMQPISNGLAISFTTGLHRGCTKFYAKKDSGIKEPKDLKGKTVGIPNLTDSSTLTMRRKLADLGIDASESSTEVNFVAYAMTDLPEALENGAVDAIGVHDPVASSAEQSYPDFIKIFDNGIDEKFKDEYCCQAYVSNELIEKNPKGAAAYTRAMQKAAAWIQANPYEAAALQIDNGYISGGDEEKKKYGAILESLNYEPNVELGRATFEHAFKDLQAIGALDPSLDYDTFLKKVYPTLEDVPTSLKYDKEADKFE